MSLNGRSLVSMLGMAGFMMVFALAAGVPGQVANAQQQAPQLTPPQQAPQKNVSDAQLEKFAKAQRKVVRIHQDYQNRAANAKDEKEVQGLVKQANKEIDTAIEGAGLSVREFNEIARAVQADDELRQKLINMLNS